MAAITAQESVNEPGGVCVAVMHDKKPVRIYGENASEFIEPLSKAAFAWVNFSVQDFHRDGELVATLLGFSGNMVESLLAGPYSNYDDRETELAIRFPIVKMQGLDIQVDTLIILVRDDLVLSLHEVGKAQRMLRFARYADAFMRKIPQDMASDDRQSVILARLISQNNDRNFEALRQIQAVGDRIGAKLAHEDDQRDRRELGTRIYEMKHTLVEYLDTLWASLDVIQSLRYGDAELISDEPELLARIGLLGDDVNRQIQVTEHMSSVLISGLEVLQSMYNNDLQRLNNRLALVVAWLTILGTAILVPNTIATMFGTVSDFEGGQRTLYIAVLAAATFLSTLLAFLYVRRKGLLPDDDD